MTEAIGNIPITFFIIDELKVKEETKEIISQLIDIESSRGNLHIDREKLILKVFKELKIYLKKIK